MSQVYRSVSLCLLNEEKRSIDPLPNLLTPSIETNGILKPSLFSSHRVTKTLSAACLRCFWRGIKENKVTAKHLSSLHTKETEISVQHFLFTSPRSLPLSHLLSLLAWSPCPSGVCWGYRMEMNPDGVSGIWQHCTIKVESRCTSTHHGGTESMGFQHCKLWVSQWFAALKSYCICAYCAQRPAVADSFISTHYR